jgi:energy-coupling factor transporter ATP-binding protein EcfA2
MLMLRGDLVLHASAAIAGTGAIAFVGDSGMGKSTLATLLALAGAPLLTDDVLRVGPGPEFAVYAGATETRLRDGAIAMVEGGTTVRGTADGRTAVSFGVAGGDSVRLACVVVPFPARDIAALRATRLTARDALVLLVRFPRVLGWRDRATAAQQFGQLADLVEAVPVFTASVPWGPPFPEGLAPDLLSLVE